MKILTAFFLFVVILNVGCDRPNTATPAGVEKEIRDYFYIPKNAFNVKYLPGDENGHWATFDLNVNDHTRSFMINVYIDRSSIVDITGPTKNQ